MTAHEVGRPGAALAAAAEQLRQRAQPTTPTTVHSVLVGDEDATAQAALLDDRRDEWQATIPRRFWSARVDDFTGPNHDELAAWADDPDRGNLVLLGAVGVGKTHAAVAACRPAYGRGASLMVLPVGELLDQLDWRRPDSATTLEHLCTVDLLVVDDLGTERSNEWTGERLYLVVNRRWLDMRPTIVTSNLDPEPLAAEVGERTYSRLAHGAVPLNLTGKDRRRG